ncbi:MAG: hypothetical protein ACOY4K_03450 [Pseudomonadota bacterium]
MTAQDRLTAFLNEGRGPEPDPAFAAAVMERVARREALRSVLVTAAMSGASAVALWASAPMLTAVLEPMARTLLPTAAVLVATAGLTALGLRLAPGPAGA